MAQDEESILQFITQYTEDFASYSALRSEEQRLSLEKQIEQWVGYRNDYDAYWANAEDFFTVKESIEGAKEEQWMTTNAAMEQIFGESWVDYKDEAKEVFDKYLGRTADETLAQEQLLKAIESGQIGPSGVGNEPGRNKTDFDLSRWHPAGEGGYTESSGSTPSQAEINRMAKEGAAQSEQAFWNYYWANLAPKKTTTKTVSPTSSSSTTKQLNVKVSVQNDGLVNQYISGKKQEKNISALLGFASGGMVDFTGLAMLHGSKQQPQAVLNPQQTRFLRNDFLSGADTLYTAIRDLNTAIHSTADSSTYSSIERGEYITIENASVNMNVNSIDNDYDAQRAGATALDEMLKIARKSGTRGMSRR